MPLKDLAKFDAEYDSSHEDTALQTRGVFIRRFPLHSLDKLTLENTSWVMVSRASAI